ncbi:Sua5/YciO/YrdC/YwlC family protein [Mycoplasma zalophi]|uniref:Sua5/YciO/YrdC/YwlC family protein n=1 Tax=Mycoplasma zalophi TaxID=191287 RepID=A0ABS6DQ93_9MOLU|nr:Sua5/YciO/YrdC/YwlC family protein [Mycoplasma zalophi]MBU4691205.1 Sua5/YciO/YrdC/YwlC family protein [Mycoplasma zalophi]MBU4692020.1 Sua5/YciO/YrdC/YwlC family protein [Mycoplasma zalophi]
MNNKFKDVFICTTDTVMGIGVKMKDNNINLLYELKQRNLDKKIIILVSSIKQVEQITNLNQNALDYIQKYWPGAVTLIINDIGFRMPNQDKLLGFLEQNGPCYVTSCNKSGFPVAKNIEEAKILFPEVTNFYKFGEMSQKPSLIIDVDTQKILRS